MDLESNVVPDDREGQPLKRVTLGDTLIWVAVILAIFVPFSVHLYKKAASK